jgi:hypothetical protein
MDRIVKHEDRLVGNDLTKGKEAVGNTVDYFVSQLGEEVWQSGMNPGAPTRKVDLK